MRTKSKTTLNALATCLLALAFAQAARAQANSTATNAAATQNIAGEWRGTLSAQGAQLRLVLKLAQGQSGGLTATLDSPDQNASDLPLENIKYADRILRFEFNAGAAPAVFEGELSRDGTEIAGFWQQGAPLPLVFTREQPNNTKPVAGNTQPSASNGQPNTNSATTAAASSSPSPCTYFSPTRTVPSSRMQPAALLFTCGGRVSTPCRCASRTSVAGG